MAFSLTCWGQIEHTSKKRVEDPYKLVEKVLRFLAEKFADSLGSAKLERT